MPDPPVQPVVTVTFFRFAGLRPRWWAFRQMGLAPRVLPEVPGLRFFKMLGSGHGNGFSIRPNFSVYGLLGVWDGQEAAQGFFSDHALFAEFVAESQEHWTVFLHTAAAHGCWDGQEPFPVTTPFEPVRPTAVLTRATIRTRRLWHFWRYTPPVSRSMEPMPGLLFAVGIGELPLVQQATFSVWSDARAMQAYAYQSARHREVIKQTRALNWYKEELFARFHPFASVGSWGGADPLAAVRGSLQGSNGGAV